ncbi:MAG TPA: dTDP-4-dehydrorhamnose reductase [Methylomirabilota bacterium]|nr:dTDP-4-dehydrorhamnose reductase [Methylomirabilota bacterium]
MRALVVGASGQVGGALLAALRARGHEATGTYAGHAVPDAWPLDLRNGDAVEHAVTFVKPDWIFCPAGLSHVDYCEAHPDEAMAVNRDAPLHLARMGQRFGALFVYYSTDYVFDGAGGPYGESDAPRPLNAYGRSKLEGERALLGVVPRVLVLRTSVVYGPETQEKNFVYQLVRACREGKPFRPAKDQRNSPTYNPDLAAASVELAEQGASGVYHAAGADTMDRWAFAQLIVKTFALDGSRLSPVSTAELRQPAPRPLDAGLRIDKAQAAVGTRLRGAAEGLLAMRAMLGEGKP